MGVDTRIYVNPDVDSRHAADALGRIAGLPTEYRDIGNSLNRTLMSTMVTGVHAEGNKQSPDMNTIYLAPPEGDAWMVYYHLGARHEGRIFNMMMPRCTPFWLAVGRRFIQFFGGILELSDHGEGPDNFIHSFRTCPVDAYGLIPDDGEAWDAYQQAVLELEPITYADMEEMREYSAYPESMDSLTQLNPQLQT